MARALRLSAHAQSDELAAVKTDENYISPVTSGTCGMWRKIWSGSHLDVYPHALRHSYAIVRHVDIPPLQLLLWQGGDSDVDRLSAVQRCRLAAIGMISITREFKFSFLFE